MHESEPQGKPHKHVVFKYTKEFESQMLCSLWQLFRQSSRFNFLNFPEDEKLKRIWVQKMTRGDSKFASTNLTLLFCRTLSEKDFRLHYYALLYGTICCDEEDLQDDLYRLEAWQQKWHMEFNPLKCKIMCLTTKRDPPKREYMCIFCGDRHSRRSGISPLSGSSA